MKLGISGQALGNVMSFREIVKMGKKYDITDYEIWPINANTSNDYACGDLSDIKALIRDEEINIYCVTLGCAFSADAVKDASMYSKYLINAINTAKELGATVVNHYCAAINQDENANFELLKKYWHDPIIHAQKQGITLVLENEAHDCTRTPEKMLEIMKYFNHPNFKTNFDAVNYLHASCEGFPYAYEVLKPYIGYVHIKNGCLTNPHIAQPEYNKGGSMSGHNSPSPIQYTTIPKGAVNIPGLLTAIESDGQYTGIYTLEPHTTADHVEEFYSAESQWLRKLKYFI